LRDRHLKSQLLNKHSTLTESEALQIVSSKEAADYNVAKVCGDAEQEINCLDGDSSSDEHIFRIGKARKKPARLQDRKKTEMLLPLWGPRPHRPFLSKALANIRM